MGYENAPSWFVAAQRKAKRQDTGVVQPSQKSRFASSIAAAEAEIEERARAQREAAEAAERARRDAALAEQVAAMRAEREAAERADAEAAEAAASAASMETAGETAAEPASEAAVPAAPAAPAQPLAAWETWEPPADFVEPETLPAPKLDPVQPAKQRSMLLPSLSGTITFEGRGAGAPETTSPSRSGIIRRMRADIPSLSGVIRMQNGEAAEDDVASVATVGAEAAEAVAAAPVPAEAAEAVEAAPAAENEVPATPLSRTAAPAREPARESARTARAARREPSYEDVPKSRAGRLFGRFHRKGKGADLEETPQQWLDVEDDFNPQEAGRERGGWESFRASDYDQLEPPAPSPSRGGYDDYVAPGDDEYADYDDYDKYGEYDDYDEAPRGGRRWNGGAFSRVRLGRVNMRSGSEDEPEPEPVPEFADPSLSGEIGEAAELEQVYHFRNPKFTTEVWFVAVGSELDRHDGIRAFVEHHRADLRGALLVDVEALGAGRLTAVTEEGLFRPVVASSRAKRLLKKASAASAIAPEQAPLPNFESTASVAGREGLQVLHLAGVEATRPALLGSRNDTVEAVDEDLLMENIDYLTALVQRF